MLVGENIFEHTDEDWKDYTDDIQVSKNNFVYNTSVVASEAGNPFFANDSNSVAIGSEVIALTTSAMEVSTGQFGQYPLYAFCTDGVFAISIGSDGTMQTCVPYSYDLLSRKESVSTIDRTVVFLTSQGVVQIAGGRSLLLNANPAASTGFVNDVQPDVVRAMLCAQADGALPPDLGSLTDYLTTGGQTVYDYAHGRMVLFNPAYAYCYLYSFGENSWTIVMRQYTHALNGYDNCLLVNKREVSETETSEDGTSTTVTNTYWDVWDYSQNNFVEAVSGYVMTRPMKLDYPDVLKTVQTVIQRGMFCKERLTRRSTAAATT